MHSQIIFYSTLTTLPLVSGYDAVGHDVKDSKQEEAYLKTTTKVMLGNKS